MPVLALAIPLVLVASRAVRRRPALALTMLMALSGTYGSLEAFAHISGSQVSDLLLIGLLGAVVAEGLRRGRAPRVIQPELFPVVLLVALTCVALAFAPDLELGVRSFRASTWHLLAVLTVAYAGIRLASFETFAKGTIVVAVLCGAYATYRWGVGEPDPKEAALTPKSLLVYNEVAGESKVLGALPSGHELGFWSASITPFLTALALTWRGRWRFAAAAALPLCLIGMLGSGNRSAIVGFAGGAALVLGLILLSRAFPGPRLGTALAAVVLVLGGAGGAFVAVLGDNPEKLQRYEYILHPSDDLSVQERLFKWRNAFADIEGHPLGRGLGTGGVTFQFQRFRGAGANFVDNSYVKIAYEQGVGAMILFIDTILTLLFGLSRRAVWTRSPRRASIAIGAAGTLFSMAIVFVTGLYIDGLAALAGWLIVGAGFAQFAMHDDDVPPAAPAPARQDDVRPAPLEQRLPAGIGAGV